MKIVEAGENGINVTLSPECQDKIFTDATDDGKDVVIVKGRVVRVDTPSARMSIALNQEIPDPAGKGGPHKLLVETKDAPTKIEEPLQAQLSHADKAQEKAILEAEAARLGFTLHEVPASEGDSTDLHTGRVIGGQVPAAPAPRQGEPPKGAGDNKGK